MKNQDDPWADIEAVTFTYKIPKLGYLNNPVLETLRALSRVNGSETSSAHAIATAADHAIKHGTGYLMLTADGISDVSAEVSA